MSDIAELVCQEPVSPIELQNAGEERLEVEREAEFGSRNARMLPDQKRPKKEVDQHNLTHLPYRNWCQHFGVPRVRRPLTFANRIVWMDIQKSMRTIAS